LADLRGSVRKSRLEGLKALRDVTAGAIEEVDPHLRAPLIRQLTIILGEIFELEGEKPQEKGSVLDDLAARREARTARAARSASS